MRLFVALDLDDAIRERINLFVEGIRSFAADARWISPESMHVTLKFIGEQPEATVEPIKHALASIRHDAPIVHFRGYGFFPTAKSARVFWAGIEAGPELETLATSIDAITGTLGIPAEHRPYSPHLTLARSRGGSGSPRRHSDDGPNRVFQRLQEKLTALPAPAFGTMTPRGFFLYRSQLSPKGSTYTKLARFPLKYS
ncbi:MAG TPA: RNA 2',3'-cyclic phosphodiesterase [Candidatus Sulfotelmatobacter sp.]|jgi:2'-5' RNA ligase